MKNVGDFALNERSAVNQRLGTLDLEELIIKLLDIHAGLSVLDIACGNGRYTLKYKKEAGHGFIAGIDQSKNLIRQAKVAAKNAGLAVDFIVADSILLPYKNSCFDRVSCNYAIYHFQDIAASLDEMFRVLKKSSSKLIITGPAQNNNSELYHYHEAAGGRFSHRMGRYVYEKEVKEYLVRRSINYAFCVYQNVLTFDSIPDYLGYYKDTKLFLDNIMERDRDAFLEKVAERMRSENTNKPSLTKEIGVFEIWN